MEEKKKSKSKLIIIVAVALAVIAAVVAVIIINLNKEEVINDDYFHSTGNRLVYEAKYNDETMSYGANRVFDVYKYEGDEVKDYTVYYEYNDDYGASKALSKITAATKGDKYIGEIKQVGKYVAEVHSDEFLMYMSIEEIREDIESKQNYQNIEPEDVND